MKYQQPDRLGHFGIYGGRYVPETLMAALDDLARTYASAKKDLKFQNELNSYLRDYAGRPTPVFEARRLTKHYSRARIFIKREDLCHTGSHKINNAMAQGLLARRLGKKRIVAETGAGQHGVASATVASVLGLDCVVYMGAEDIKRQALNVYKMNLFGAEVRSVTAGSQTLKDATSEAIRDWVTNVDSTHYLIGSVMGPHPYPMMVRDFQSIIGQETRRYFLKHLKRLPTHLVACVGGGSNAIGFFYPFLKDKSVKMFGLEAAGLGINTPQHAASLTKGFPGILHGMKSYLLQNKSGQVQVAHSISAGLDYPSVGPEHSFLKDSKRVTYAAVTDQQALKGFHRLTRLEGIMPALEPSHALGYLDELMPRTKKGDLVCLNLSGRGDKDIHTIQNYGKNHE